MGEEADWFHCVFLFTGDENKEEYWKERTMGENWRK